MLINPALASMPQKTLSNLAADHSAGPKQLRNWIFTLYNIITQRLCRRAQIVSNCDEAYFCTYMPNVTHGLVAHLG